MILNYKNIFFSILNLTSYELNISFSTVSYTHLVFGVNLKLIYPFIGALIGSAVSSAYATFMKVLSLSPGPAVLPGVIVIRAESSIQYMITMLMAFVVAFISTVILAKILAKKKEIV